MIKLSSLCYHTIPTGIARTAQTSQGAALHKIYYVWIREGPVRTACCLRHIQRLDNARHPAGRRPHVPSSKSTMSKNRQQYPARQPPPFPDQASIPSLSKPPDQTFRSAPAVKPLYGRDSLTSTRFFGVAMKKFRRTPCGPTLFRTARRA